MTRDKNGFVSIDLRNVGYKTEPFVLVKDVQQVFYVSDTVRTMRHMVLRGKRRIIGVQNTVMRRSLISLMKSLLSRLVNFPA